MKTLKRTLPGLLALVLLTTVGVARADLFNFNFAGSGQSASGSLMANATGVPGQVQITSLTGMLTGVPIAFLLPPQGFGANDNLLHLSGSTYLPDTGGFSFQLTDDTQVNVFTFSGAPFDGQQFLARSDGTLAAMTTFQITPAPVPEPSSWMLLGSGGLGLAATMRRRVLRRT